MRTNVPFKSNRNVVYSCKYRRIRRIRVVWCPKSCTELRRSDRRPVLVDGVDVRLKEILHQTAEELGADIIELEIMPEHVHLLCETDPQFGIHRLVKRLKGRSSRLLRQEFPWLKSRLPTLWTHSYPSTSLRPGFVATVGSAPLEIIKQYIGQQKGR